MRWRQESEGDARRRNYDFSGILVSSRLQKGRSHYHVLFHCEDSYFYSPQVNGTIFVCGNRVTPANCTTKEAILSGARTCSNCAVSCAKHTFLAAVNSVHRTAILPTADEHLGPIQHFAVMGESYAIHMRRAV